MIQQQNILIPIPALFSLTECVWFLNRNYDDCLHVINGRVIKKAVKLNEKTIVFGLYENGNFLEVNILDGEVDLEERTRLTDYVREWLDLGKDITPFYDLLKTDDRLSYMCDEFRGLRLVGIADLFETLCWCIIGQQINLSFAYKLKRRLVENYGTAVELDNEVHYIFPSCEILSDVTREELRSMQFSDKKAEYIIGVANAFKNGTLSKDMLTALPDLAIKQKTLTDHKGIGIWTANYALMKSLREPRCIPHGDIGLLNALTNHGIIADRSETGRISAFFSAFAGWESYLVFYLWRSLSFKSLA